MVSAGYPAPVRRPTKKKALPRWPLTLALVGFPLWWLLGLAESAWLLAAVVMAVYLVRRGSVVVPRWFGIWLLFLLWMLFSGIGVDSFGRLLGFVYRAAQYLGLTVFFVYAYNARKHVTARYIAGLLTAFWLIVVIGGYVGIAFPLFQIKTVMAYVVPGSIASNELVHEMIYRRVTQFDPNSFTATAPRPSAPFLYTNGWGNAYSLLMPVVLAYLTMVRRRRRFWWILLAIPASAVPALLTLNRGMGLGLAIAFVYASFRFAVLGRLRAVLSLAGVVGVLALIGTQLPIAQSLTERLEESTTTGDRLRLYTETIQRTLESPLFGYGAPRPSVHDGLPSVGTQGQIWMVMFSHGLPAVALFFGWFLVAYFRTLRQRTPMGLAANTMILVLMVECLYYGVLPIGLTITMLVAAVALRQPISGEVGPAVQVSRSRPSPAPVPALAAGRYGRRTTTPSPTQLIRKETAT